MVKGSFNKINLFLLVLSSSFMLIFFSCSDDSIELDEELIEEEKEVPIYETCASGVLFVEKDGLVRVDIENSGAPAKGWTKSTSLSGFEGSGYLIWTGTDNFNEPGQGLMKCSIKINTPGTYQFVWSSRIGMGNSNTEHNDSWLRIEGDDFFGEKVSTGDRVYPIGSGKSPNPEGSSKDGWLKAYMNRLGEWFYRSSTNDKDPYDIFVKFNNPGTYDVEISGRSRSHAIDQFVLFKTDKTLSQATSSALSEIICK